MFLPKWETAPWEESSGSPKGDLVFLVVTSSLWFLVLGHPFLISHSHFTVKSPGYCVVLKSLDQVLFLRDSVEDRF